MDPDQPTFLRLEILEKAGFAKIAGVRFELCGQKGIVVFFAKKDVDTRRLKSPEHEMYLQNVAKMLGATAALTNTRTSLRKQIAPKEKTESINEDENITKIISEKNIIKN